MKKILVNAISIKEGGGLVVLTRLLEEMSPLQLDIQWLVVVDSSIRSKINTTKNIQLLSFQWIKNSQAHLFYWYEIYLPALIRRIKIDLVFSQTNFLPFKKLPCPSLLLVHQAGYFSDVFSALQLQQTHYWYETLIWKFRCYWVNTSIKRATRVTAQTQALADAIVKKTKILSHKIAVVPHGAGLATGKIQPKQFPMTTTIWRIGYITKYGIQKNFDVLFKALQQLKIQGKNCKLILTLDPKHPPFHHIEALIKEHRLDDCIENHGEIDAPAIRALYQSLDLFVFPSLCESFGFTLVEAMYYGIPVLAADTPSNREILGDAGGFFKSDQADVLTEKIGQLMENKDAYEKSTAHNLVASKQYDWHVAAKNILAVVNEIA